MRDGPAGQRPRHHGVAHLSVRALLVVVVLVPTVAMAATVGMSVTGAWADRQAARQLEDEVSALVAIIDARGRVADEDLAASVLTVASDLGVDPGRLEELYGVDYAGQLGEAQQAVDDDPIIGASPQLQEDLAALRSFSPALAAGTATFDDVHGALTRLKGHIDELWTGRIERFAASDPFQHLPFDTRAQVDVLGQTFTMLSASNRRADLAQDLLTEPGSAAEAAALLEADANFTTAVRQFKGELGPAAAAAWRRFSDSEAAQQFEATLGRAAEVGVAGADPPLADQPAAFGDAFAGGAPWTSLLSAVVLGAADDLTARTHTDAQAATRTAGAQTLLAAALVLLSLGSAALLARMVARPIRHLGDAAREIRDGHFDVPPIPPSGPRELSDTAAAFNEMALTLVAVETQTVLLAEDPGGAAPPTLPGRTGRALHVAFDRLQRSMAAAEQDRAELQELAVRDGMTGLLNRAAAEEALQLDLARAAREGGQVMVLFLDLDGLKAVNDRFGHEAGDAALIQVADALRATTRETDTVARQGGDEFLVAGRVDSPAEVERLAERIRAEVEGRTLEWSGARLPLTCSIGMAVGRTPEVTSTELIAQADAALYDAKEGGRNRARWGPALVP